MQLELVPVQLVSWGDWVEQHPSGKVLSRDTGHTRDYGRNPYESYDTPGTSPFLYDGRPDPRLQPDEDLRSGLRRGRPDGKTDERLRAYHSSDMATPEQNHLVPGGLGAVAAHDRAVRVLYDSSHVAVGEFHCWPDDPRWKEENCTWEGHFVVFPGTTVKIAQAGRKHPVVTTLNDVLFYNRDQAYRRAMVSRRGDHCTFLLVSPALLEDVARESVPDLIDPLDRPFPGAHAPTDAPTFMLERLVVQRVRAGVAHDGLRIQECLYEVVGRAIRSLFRFRALRTDAGRPATRDQHAEMVEQAKTLLASALAEPLSLEEIGRRLYVSPYHLARVFRAQTGFALHEYRDHLRVRASVDRMGDSAQPITDVATSVGYASPSHFTDAFRRRFGFAPSTARRWARAGQLDQPRRRLS